MQSHLVIGNDIFNDKVAFLLVFFIFDRRVLGLALMNAFACGVGCLNGTVVANGHEDK